MGFGTVVSELIIFISVMGLAVSLTVMMSSQMTRLDHVTRQMSKARADKLGTDIAIIDVSYNSTSTNVSIVAKNIGTTSLNVTRTDLLVDGERVSRSQMTRTIPADSDGDTIGVWDPSETLLIEVNLTLSTGQHEAKLSTENAVYDTYQFST